MLDERQDLGFEVFDGREQPPLDAFVKGVKIICATPYAGDLPYKDNLPSY
ncbi:MAG: hypothetical protein RBG13Loki_4218 [Promethearchaeota archaeon CR_4]|nr:MAG: hypothetical protein RBG13Loki_4218 [Candidatus Lokiarchaeota archaeon CR_4]